MANCPQCRAELDPADPAGLCPRCLIAGAFDSSLSAEEAGTQTIETASETLAEDDFGRYQILRPLGEGGMGTVYLAEQRAPIRRPVALKVIKLGMDTSQVLARFANERQALAIMDHPNIARIFDAGATRRGRPYFVMEYIEGAPITEYCDRRRMTVGERLPLFLAVCRAVQHAHQKGVIHRDLKPSNVLVKEQEGSAVPKVIDFGIARATDQWAVETTLLTQFGQMVGTPEYASPEQAEVTAGVVDESSDVYSLGVILYELLIGTVPFETAVLRKAGLAEMLRIIREEEAPPLSRRLMSTGAQAVQIAAQRRTDAASLRRLVDGDLNRITMKALEKSRARRYGSVAELAADIQRYLEHRPVLASPPGALYRAGKYLRRRRPVILGAAAGLAAILLSAATLWLLMQREPRPAAPLANKGTLVLADVANSTGDPALGGTLRQLLASELGKSSRFSVLPDGRVRQTLRYMVRPADTRLSTDVASEICERTGSAAVVEGSIMSLGNAYLVSLRARNCRTGDVLDEEQTQAAKKEEAFEALSPMARRLQTRAAELLPSVPKEPSLPNQATTSSLEAWRSYSAAMKILQRGAQTAESIPLLKRAVEIDPKFAMAYAYLGREQANFGEIDLGARNTAQAYALRNLVSDQENDFITFSYHRQVTGNLELARQGLESWAQKTPGDLIPHGFLAAFATQGLGLYTKAAEEGEKAIRIDPKYAIGYENTVFAYIYSNNLREADALLRRASEQKVDNPDFSFCRYFIAFLGSDQAAMDRESALRRARMQSQGWFEQQEALTAAWHGRLSEAAHLSDRAVNLALQAGLRERAGLFEGARAAWSALFGLPDGQRVATAAMSISRGRDADYGPAFALLLLHDSVQAPKIEMNLAKRYPEDTCVQFNYLPALQALEALNHGNAAQAVEKTQTAATYEFAIPATAWYNGAFFGALYPIYVRGLAYAQTGRHREAAAEFQKIVDHLYITLNDPIGPMARLGLARALQASGDHAKSAAVYKDLLAVWKDADPDVPVVQQARAEAAREP